MSPFTCRRYRDASKNEQANRFGILNAHKIMCTVKIFRSVDLKRVDQIEIVYLYHSDFLNILSDSIFLFLSHFSNHWI